MASYKFIGGDGKTYGPFPLEKLRQFVTENRLNAQSQVQKDDGPFAPSTDAGGVHRVSVRERTPRPGYCPWAPPRFMRG